MQNQASDFLNAIFACTDSPISFEIDGKRFTHAGGSDFLQKNLGHLRVGPVTDAGSCFVFGVLEDAQPEDSVNFRLQPTAILEKDTTLIFVWGLKEPVDCAGLSSLAEAPGMTASDEHIAVPGTDGWTLRDVKPECLYTLDEMLAAYCVEDEATEGPEGVSAAGANDATEPLMLNDAICVTPYNGADYDKEIVIAEGVNSHAKHWKRETMAVGQLIANLSRHRVGKKDGLAYVPGDMFPGERKKERVKSIYAGVLDIDTGTPSAVVDAAIAETGCVAVRYSTHSHGHTETEIKKDKVTKFTGDREITDELKREYLREIEQWDESLVREAIYEGEEHTENGYVCKIVHPRMPKHRVFFPFEVPYVFADEAKTTSHNDAMKKWARVLEALATKLGVPFDKSCTDPSRLFYYPRHAEGAQYEISVFGGKYLDWRTLDLDDSLERVVATLGKGKSKSQTDEGRALGRWSMKRAHGFQIADVIEARAPDCIRHNTGHGLEIECPFDEDHGNSGDPTDRACLVVNAGEGPSEWFTISCRHESCRTKTNLDMLGKCIKDGRFGADVLEDEQFNAILEDDAKPAGALKSEKQDSAADTIGTLTKDSTSDEINVAIAPLADLGGIEQEQQLKRIKDRTGLSLARLKSVFSQARAVERKKAETPDKRDVHLYVGDSPDFVEATAACKAAIKKKNAKDSQPTYSHIKGAAVRLDMEDGRALFTELDQRGFWGDLCELLLFRRVGESGEGKREKVPEDVAKQVFTQARTLLDPAPEVIYTPMYLRDSTLLVKPGYDKTNNLILICNGLNVEPPPRKPSVEKTQEALDFLLDDLLGEFPFFDIDKDGNEIIGVGPSRTHALASLVTPFVRRKFSGQTPCFFVRKPQPGTGGSMLAKLPGMLADGRITEIPYQKTDEEMAKVLGAEVLKGTSSCAIFENLKDFNNRTLIGAFTLPTIKTRLLGQSSMIEAPNIYNWGASGNNTGVKAEMARRVVWMHLNRRMTDAEVLNYPFTRALETYVPENRAKIIHCILTLIQWWIADNCVPFTARTLKNFEPWAASVGGVLQACGVEGFLEAETPETLDMSDADETEFLTEVAKKYSGATERVTFKDLFAWASDAQLAVLKGHAEEEKRAGFARTVQGCVGRAFKREGANYVLQAVAGGLIVKKVATDGAE